MILKYYMSVEAELRKSRLMKLSASANNGDKDSDNSKSLKEDGSISNLVTASGTNTSGFERNQDSSFVRRPRKQFLGPGKPDSRAREPEIGG